MGTYKYYDINGNISDSKNPNRVSKLFFDDVLIEIETFKDDDLIKTARYEDGLLAEEFLYDIFTKRIYDSEGSITYEEIWQGENRTERSYQSDGQIEEDIHYIGTKIIYHGYWDEDGEFSNEIE